MIPSPEYVEVLPPQYQVDNSQPPSYKPSLSFYGITLMKTEFTSPYHINNKKRSWTPVVLELNSTQLIVYSLNVEKKLYDLLLALYHEENSLQELVDKLCKDRPDNDFNDYTSEDPDMFAGDAYGADFGMNNGSLLLKSKSTLIRDKFLKKKLNKRISHDFNHYFDLLKDNQMLFEPITSTMEYETFSAKYRGEKLHCWTLQNLSAGEAPSLNQVISSLYKEDNLYKKQNLSTLVKYSNVLRVRIEIRQVLFQFWSFHGMIHWYQNLNIGKDLSTTLEDRQFSRLKTIPNRSNLRNNALLVAAAAAAYDDSNGTNLSIQFNESFEELDVLSLERSKCEYDVQSSVQSSIFDSSHTISSINSETSNSIKPSSKLYSRDTYTSLEKQYISNCLPDLNSYDRWTGVDVVLSNYHSYLNQDQINELKTKTNMDLLISISSLDNSNGFFKRSRPIKKKHVIENGSCRGFFIHQNGLVSISV